MNYLSNFLAQWDIIQMHLFIVENHSIVKFLYRTFFSAGAISANSTNETSADLYSRFLKENPSPFKGWKEGFVAFAEYVAKSADNCGTLQAYLLDILPRISPRNLMINS